MRNNLGKVFFNWYEGINKVNKILWNEPLSDKDFLHHTSFLEVVDRSKINNAEIHYFTVSNGEKYICTAVVSVFEMNLDLFVQNKKIINFIKKIFPNLFKIKLVFCGIPVSSGQSNLWIDPEYTSQLDKYLHEISRKMDELSQEYKALASSFKEFSSPTVSYLFNGLTKLNYSLCWSLPTVDLYLPETSQAYWKSLSHNRRRQIKTSLQKIGFTYLY